MRIWSFVFLLSLMLPVRGQELVSYACDLTTSGTLQGWTDELRQKPASKSCSIVSESGAGYLRLRRIKYGISHPLDHPILIDGRIRTLTVQMDVFNPQASTKSNTMSMGLSSRKTVDRLGKFYQIQDSFLGVRGSSSANYQGHNYLLARKSGYEIRSRKPTLPFNLLTSNDAWNTWKLVYDHEHKRLSFYNVSMDSEHPLFSLYGTDFSGVEFKSVWINGDWQDSHVRHVRVSYEKVD